MSFKLLILALSASALLAAENRPSASASQPAAKAHSNIPPFEAGDRIVFLGDSITSGGPYHQFIRTYWATRFPEKPIQIWNKGIFSDFAKGGLRRLEHDTLEEKPNKVVVNFGMNDSGASYRQDLFGMENPSDEILAGRANLVAAFGKNIGLLIQALTAQKATPILAGPSIYDETLVAPGLNQTGGNSAIRACIDQLREISARENLGFVDFNTPMLEINQRLQAENPESTIVGPDRVHPGPSGHWVMALAFLQAQGAAPIVAEASIDASNSTAQRTTRCKLTDLAMSDEGISFTYAPEALPLPADADYTKADQILGLSAALNREVLAVHSLAPGRYALRMNDRLAGEFDAEEFAAGVNIATLPENPGQKKSLALLDLIQERRRQENRIRALRQNDAGDLSKLRSAESEAVIATYRAQLEKARADGNAHMANRWTKWFEDFPQEPSIRTRIEELDHEIYRANTPAAFRIEITRTPRSRSAEN